MSSENKKTILLVEDEAITAMLETQQLEKYGYTVHHVNTGEKAVERIIDEDFPVDIVLMDIDLGDGIDGTQAAEQILNNKDIPVLFLSFHSEPEIVDKTEKITSYGYVVKGSKITVLDASIKMALKLFDAKKLVEYSELKQKTMISNISDVIVIIDLDGINRYKSSNLEQWFGWNPKELLGKSTWDNVHPEDLKSAQVFLEGLIGMPGATGTTECRYLCKDGSYKWIEITITNLLHNPLIRGFLGNYHDITEAKIAQKKIIIKTEELVAANENLLSKEKTIINEKIFAEALLECLPGYLYVYDDQGNLIRWNKKHETMTGYSADELSKKKMSDWFEGEDAVRVVAAMDKVLRTGSGEVEANLLINGGEKLLIHSNGVRLTIDGETYFVGVGIDITDRKRAEDELKESKLFLEKIVETVPVPIFYKDTQGRYTGFNQHFEDFFGKSREELIGKSVFDIAPEELAKIYHAQDKELFDKIGTQIYDSKVKTARGETKDVVFHKASLVDNEGEIIGLIGAILDISDRKKAEEALEESENNLSLILNKSPFPVSMSDLSQGEIRYWSQNAKKIFGHSPATVSEWYELAYPDSEYRKQVIERWKPFLEKTGESDTAVNTGEYHITCKDGSIKICEIYAQYIQRMQHNIVVTFNDITDRKMAEKEIQNQLKEKDMLLREGHHRIKNNIASIEGMLSLQADSTESLVVKTAIQEAVTRIQSTRVLYENLLLANNSKTVSVKNYVESLIDSFLEVFQTLEPITVKTQIQDFDMISKKAGSIGIIINELMTNVFKYAFDNGDNGEVNLSIEKSENTVTITVKDNGVGIEERTKANVSPGFGLTIVKMLVEQLKGSYDVRNNNGTESVIQFEI